MKAYFEYILGINEWVRETERLGREESKREQSLGSLELRSVELTPYTWGEVFREHGVGRCYVLRIRTLRLLSGGRLGKGGGAHKLDKI